MESLQIYPYLASSLANVFLFLLLAAVAPSEVRRFALSGAVLALPCALQARLDVPGYWNPVRLFTAWGIGVEDFLCAFSLTGLACLLAAWPARRAILLTASFRGSFARYLVIAAAGLGSRLVLRALAVPVNTALVGSTVLLAVAILCLQPARWPLALAGALCFAPAYFLLVKGAFMLLPGYPAQWNRAVLWGPTVAGVPLEELVWGWALGAAWPLATAHVFQGRAHAAREVA